MPTGLCGCFCCPGKAPTKHEVEAKVDLDKLPRQQEEYVAASVPYGTLYAYGYNGQLPLQTRGRYKSAFKLEQRPIANGVSAVNDIQQRSDETNKIPSGAHLCYFNASSMKAITQFEIDKNKDMYQIGRSAESPVDFIVMDTVAGEEYISDTFATRSTINGSHIITRKPTSKPEVKHGEDEIHPDYSRSGLKKRFTWSKPITARYFPYFQWVT